MPSKWTKRLHIIIPVGIANAAFRRGSMGAVFSVWTGESVEDESLMFSARLSVNGIEPATHLGASTLLTDDLFDAVDAEMKRNLLPAANWDLIDVASGASLAGNTGIPMSNAPTFDDLLSYSDLMQIIDREE